MRGVGVNEVLFIEDCAVMNCVRKERGSLLDVLKDCAVFMLWQ